MILGHIQNMESASVVWGVKKAVRKKLSIAHIVKGRWMKK
jgi:hypothetical protein